MTRFEWGSILACLVLAAAGCDSEPRSDYVPDGYALVFSDEFNSLDLQTEQNPGGIWTTWWDGWGVRFLTGNNDKAWKCDSTYADSTGEKLGIRLHEISEDGALRLYGRTTPPEKRHVVNDFPYIGGMISNRNAFSQTFGYVEVRARFEVSKGIHWALWLLPSDNDWPPEIDMVEVVGHQPNLVHMNAHGTGEEGEFISIEVESTADYHVYGFQWTKDEMIWTLDGEIKKERENYVDKPMYLLLSPEIGGNWPGIPDSTTVWPTVAEVDYVRIYE